jgi:hypothetical protein
MQQLQRRLTFEEDVDENINELKDNDDAMNSGGAEWADANVEHLTRFS